MVKTRDGKFPRAKVLGAHTVDGVLTWIDVQVQTAPQFYFLVHASRGPETVTVWSVRTEGDEAEVASVVKRAKIQARVLALLEDES